MSRVNQELSRGNPWQMFVTALRACWTLRREKLFTAMQDTNPLSCSGLKKKPKCLKRRGAPPFVFFDNFSYESDTIQLRPGDALVLYTDGVTEAMNKERKLLSSEGIKQALRSCPVDNAACNDQPMFIRTG